jgi:SSS family solute:Na+ symporter
VFVAIGTLLWLWVESHPGVVPADILAKSDAVFPWFIVNQLPAGVTGLLVAAIIAAAMSTISSTLNSGATVLFEDYRRRFAREPISHGSQILFLRLSTVALGVFAVLVALLVMNVTSVLTTWWALQSVLSGGMLGLFLLGAFARRTRKVQAAISTLLGMAAVFWIVFGQSLTFGRQLIHLNLAIVLGTVTLVISGVLLCRLPSRKGRR